MSFPLIGIKSSSESAIFRSPVDEKGEGYCLPSGVASEPSSPVKNTLKNKAKVTSFHGRGVINAVRSEGGRNRTPPQYITRYMELVKDVFPHKCYEESSSYLSHLVHQKRQSENAGQ